LAFVYSPENSNLLLMDTTFTASTSEKNATGSGGGTTPFDQIAAREQQEESRVQKEIEAMERENDNAEKVSMQREAQADQENSETAKKELKHYAETELSQILRQKDQESKQECASLESSYNQKAPDIVRNLVDTMTKTDSPLYRAT